MQHVIYVYIWRIETASTLFPKPLARDFAFSPTSPLCFLDDFHFGLVVVVSLLLTPFYFCVCTSIAPGDGVPICGSETVLSLSRLFRGGKTRCLTKLLHKIDYYVILFIIVVLTCINVRTERIVIKCWANAWLYVCIYIYRNFSEPDQSLNPIGSLPKQSWFTQP